MDFKDCLSTQTSDYLFDSIKKVWERETFQRQVREEIRKALEEECSKHIASSREEEIDFTGLSEYFLHDFISDELNAPTNIYESRSARHESILAKASEHARAISKPAKERVNSFLKKVEEILHHLIVENLDPEIKVALSESQNASRIQHAEQEKRIIDAILLEMKEKQLSDKHLVDEQQQKMVEMLSLAFDEEKKKNPSLRSMEIDMEILPRGDVLDAYTVTSAEEGSVSSVSWQEFASFSWKNHKQYLSLFGIGGLGKTIALLSLDYPMPVIYVPLRNLVDFRNDLPIANYLMQNTLHSSRELYDALIMRSEQEWQNQPQLVLLLDGMNEVKKEERDILLREVRTFWAGKRGLQIVIASRYDVSEKLQDIPFCRLLLDPLTPDKISAFLQKADVDVPVQSSRLWNVIDTPLMLCLYAKSELLKEKYHREEVAWRDNINPSTIIWNYLQSEICRYADSYGDTLSCVIAAEFIAPYISYQMLLEQRFIIDNAAFQSHFENAYQQYLYQYTYGNLSPRLRRIQYESGDVEASRHSLYHILAHEMVLFQITDFSVQLTHQHFRDCLAAFYLFQIAQTPSDELPEEWTRPFDQYAADFLADLMQSETERKTWNRLWSYAKQLQEEAATPFLKKMLDLYRRAYGNDFSSIMFSDLNLTEISLSGCRLTDNPGHFSRARLGRNTFLGTGHNMTVSAVSWCGNGNLFLSASHDCTLRIWNASENTCELLMPFHTHYIRCAKWNPGKKEMFASAGDDQRVVYWVKKEGKWLPSVLGYCDDWIHGLAWSPSGEKIVCGDRSGGVTMFQVNECVTPCHYSHEHKDAVRHIAWSPCLGHLFATASDDGIVCIWEEEGKNLWAKKKFDKKITSIQWADHGRLLIVSDTSCVSAIDIKTQETHQLLTHDSISFLALASHKGMDYYALFWGDVVEILEGNDENGKYGLHPVAARTIDSQNVNQIICGEWDSSCRQLVCGSRGGSLFKIQIFIEEDHSERIMIGLVAGKSPLSARCSSWTADGKRLAVGYDDGQIRIWDTEQCRCVKVLTGHSDSVKCIAWSPDCRYIVSGSDDTSIRVWMPENDLPLIDKKNIHKAPVNCILWLKKNQIVSGSDDGTIRLWDFGQGEVRSPLCGHIKRIYDIAPSPNEMLLVSGGNDQTLRLWDLTSQICLQCLESGHAEPIRGVAWSMDGKTIFSASNDKTIICRGFDSNISQMEKEFQQLPPEHQDFIYSIAISGNGKYIISASTDTDVFFWDAHSWSLLGKGVDHSHFVWDISVSPEKNGKFFAASSSSDGSVKIWDITQIDTPNPSPIDTLRVLPTMDIVGCDFSLANIESEDIKKLLAMNGGLCL